MNEAENLGLRKEDLTLLGDSWMTNKKVRFVREPFRCMVLPARFPIIGSLFGMCLLSPFFAGWWWIWHKYSPEPLGPFGMFVFVSATCLGVLGPPLMGYLRIRYLNSISPLLEYDKKSDVVSLHAKTHSFTADQVVCLLLLTACSDSNRHSEFHLIADLPEGRRRHLVMTDYGPSAGTFKRTATEFAELARLPLVAAKPTDPFKFSQSEVSDVLIEGRQRRSHSTQPRLP